MQSNSLRGHLYALLAYGLWGFLPIYWKLLQALPALEILAHRLLWSLAAVGIALALRRDWAWLLRLRQEPRTVLLVAVASLLMAVNWFTYIWAVNAGFVVETSLGYFINPLVSVLLGGLFLGERLRTGQKGAIAVAAGGVLYLTISYGTLPWIALTLALSFGLYGLVKKQLTLSGLQSFSLETVFLAPPALILLLRAEQMGSGALSTGSAGLIALLVFSGVVTAIPLVSFGAAARLIPLTSLGLMQYLAPSIQFLLGIFLYREPFGGVQLVGYALIWSALLLYSLEGLARSRRGSQLRFADRSVG